MDEIQEAIKESDETGNLVIVDHGGGLFTAIMPPGYGETRRITSRPEPKKEKRGRYVLKALEQIIREMNNILAELEPNQQSLKYKIESTVLHTNLIWENVRRANVPRETTEAGE